MHLQAIVFALLFPFSSGLKTMPFGSVQVQRARPVSRLIEQYKCNDKFETPSTSLRSVAASVSAEIQNSAIRAVTKLLVTCGIGASSAYQGVLDAKAIEVLSKLVFNLFQPCLLFVNVAQTIAAQASVADSRIGYVLPIAAALQIIVGFIVGKVISLVMYDKKPTSESKQFLACTTFANSGPLPLGLYLLSML